MMDLDTKVKCPYCGHDTTYGDLIMVSGFYGCPNCYWDEEHGLLKRVTELKEHDYDSYLSGSFYEDGYKNYRKRGLLESD